MWKCPNCESENQGDFCIVCGVKKPELKSEQSTDGQDSGNYIEYCKNCASPLKKGARFCAKCGYEVPAIPVSPIANDEPVRRRMEKRDNRNVIISLIIILAAIAMFTATVVVCVMMGAFGNGENDEFNEGSSGLGFEDYTITEDASELGTEISYYEMTDVNGMSPIKDKEPYNILLLGMDNVYELTDVIMICQVDVEDGKVRLLSVPRDTAVMNLGDRVKINSLYDNGGTRELVDAVKDITGLKIHHYFMINTDAFSDVIDELGGVYFNVPKNMDYEDPIQDLYIHLESGNQHLDGDKALQLIMFRLYPKGDINRIRVQQNFIYELVNQKLTKANVAKIPDIYRIVRAGSKTDMSSSEMLSIGTDILGADMFYTHIMPGSEQQGYFVHDKKQTKELIESEFN